MPRISANGIEIAYTDQGPRDGGLPVVLIHGFPYSQAMWDGQVAALSGEHRIITYDLRGHGESEATAGPYTMELLAEDLKGLLDALDLQQVILGGFSMGGYVALAFYRAYPERVGRLLLLDTRHLPDPEQAKPGRETLAQQVEKDGVQGIADALPSRMLTEATVSGRPEIVTAARDMILAASPQGVAGSARGMALRADQTDLLPKISAPTLIVVGEEDAVAPPADSEAMASAIPNATLVKIPGAHHLSNLEKPAEFNDAIHGFLHHH